MKPPALPPSKIGNPVKFKRPIGAGPGVPRTGRIIDEVWSEPSLDPDWGWYAFTSQLIAWDHSDKRSIRITYYYQPHGSSGWRFGGQHSIEDVVPVMRRHLQRTLAKQW